MRRWDPLNERQLALLARIADGVSMDFSGGNRAATLYALRDRGLVVARREQGRLVATVADAGKFYLAYGHHPDRPAPKNEGASALIGAPADLNDATGGEGARKVHDVKWMAYQIGKSPDWVRRHLDEIPHHRFGSTVAFTDGDLTAYLEVTAVRPCLMRTTGRSRHRW